MMRSRYIALAGLLFVSALGASVSLTPAMALDYGKRQGDLKALSAVFGELHHLRRMCEPSRETDFWRERMKQMVSLEQPTASLRRQLVSAFNGGYTSAQQKHSRCSGEARRFAAERASAGRALTSKLAGGLSTEFE
ncbi:MAG: TIGR02301 family protein [Pseudomonadota bacterium]